MTITLGNSCNFNKSLPRVNNFLCCLGLALTISKTHFSWRQRGFRATGAGDKYRLSC